MKSAYRGKVLLCGIAPRVCDVRVWARWARRTFLSTGTQAGAEGEKSQTENQKTFHVVSPSLFSQA